MNGTNTEAQVVRRSPVQPLRPDGRDRESRERSGSKERLSLTVACGRTEAGPMITQAIRSGLEPTILIELRDEPGDALIRSITLDVQAKNRLLIRWEPALAVDYRVDPPNPGVEEIVTAALEAAKQAAEAAPKEDAPMSNLLMTFTSSATREQLVALLTDETVSLETLRHCVYIALSGDTGDPSAAPTAPAPAPKPVKANGNASKGDSSGVAAVVEALIASGVGFARADVVQAASCSPAQASTAIKNAVAGYKLKSYGDRRFSRYGRTVAIAKAASEAAQKSG